MKKTHIRTLFATHYHELTVLEDKLRGLRNLNVDVAEEDGNIIFLHKIIEGSASRSYGIHVAKLAGIPSSLLERAEEKLSELERGETPSRDERKDSGENTQISLFTDNSYDPLREKIRSVNLMETTPSQAIRILEELKDIIE